MRRTPATRRNLIARSCGADAASIAWTSLASWWVLGIRLGLAASQHPPFLLPSQIVEREQSSTVRYSVEQWDRHSASPDLFWKPQIGPVVSPTVVSTPSPHVAEFPFDPRAVALLEKAEPLFQAGRCGEATGLYRQALDLSPRCYLALLSLGDCALEAGDPKGALDYYTRAHGINPSDYITFFYQGTALAELGRPVEALEAYVDALAMRPRRATILEAMKNRGGPLRVRIVDEPFVPKVSVRATGEEIHVGWDPEAGPQWLSYGLCKALWIGDSAHRKDMLAREAHVWSNIEEEECLASLLGVYATERKKGTIQPEPALERLAQVARDDLLDGFILYEIGSRVDPDLMLTAQDSERRLVREYIRRYVAISQPDAEAGRR
jgi:tetratricopeptide (TPR) repeat protein